MNFYLDRNDNYYGREDYLYYCDFVRPVKMMVEVLLDTADDVCLSVRNGETYALYKADLTSSELVLLRKHWSFVKEKVIKLFLKYYSHSHMHSKLM